MRLVLLLTILGCVHQELTPDPNLIVPYSYKLENAEPFPRDPFIAVFEKGPYLLSYVAARHSNRPTTPTYKLIDEALTKFQPKILVLEGFSYSEGESPKGLLQAYQRTSSTDFYKWGETAYSAIEADRRNIKFIGAEPDDPEVLKQVEKAGFSAKDLLGFYFVRQIPQYQRDGRLDKQSLEKLFEEFNEQSKRDFGRKNLKFSYQDFLTWYETKNGKQLHLKNFDSEEAAPIPDGEYYTQKIAHEVGMTRDRFIVKVIGEQLNKYKNVLVVYGKSHLPIQRKALEAMLGKPSKQYKL